jgi:hypothetical protein
MGASRNTTSIGLKANRFLRTTPRSIPFARYSRKRISVSHVHGIAVFDAPGYICAAYRIPRQVNTLRKRLHQTEGKMRTLDSFQVFTVGSLL